MADVLETVEMSEMLAIVAAFVVGGYFIYKYWKSASCVAKLGTVPGITGASQSQVCAPNVAAQKLRNGGATVWSCGSDFDYLQPCQQIITEARHNPVNYIWPWSDPVTYTDVPINCYTVKCGAAFTTGLAAASGAQSC